MYEALHQNKETVSMQRGQRWADCIQNVYTKMHNILVCGLLLDPSTSTYAALWGV